MAESNRSRQCQELFQQALDLEVGLRAGFLQQACGGDPELQDEVEALLAADSRAEQFLESPLHRLLDESSQQQETTLPKKIGRYEILREIGAGGMGTVYEALQEKPRRSVALKVLRPGVAAPSAVRRFLLEAEILARLRHPGIGQIYEAGTADGTPEGAPYFAMEYVAEARPITEFAVAENLSVRSRLELFAEVCDAVHHGHQRSVIHRDLKPGNILVDRNGQAKVIDFGVARATDADSTLATQHTDLGHVVGTLRYMSPEQCSGDSDKVDTRSDIYSLGVVLHELLTGQLPYDFGSVSSFEIPRIIRSVEPHRISAHDRSLRGDLETIVLKALDKDSSRRYASVAELAEDVRRFLRREPIQARRDSNWYVLAKTLDRHRVAATVVLSFVVFLSVATVALSILLGRENEARLGAEQARGEAQRAQADEQAAREEVERRLEELRRTSYFSTIGLAASAAEGENPLQVQHLLEKCPEDLRGFEWAYLQRLSDTSNKTLVAHRDRVSCVVHSPDGSRFVTGSLDGTIKVWDAKGVRLLRTLEGHDGWSGADVAFSPDGSELVGPATEPADANIWNVETGEVTRVLHDRGDRITAASWSPDGQLIVTGTENGLIRIWDAHLDKARMMIPAHQQIITILGWLPQSQHLITGSADQMVKVWDLETGEPIQTFHHNHRVVDVDAHPTENWVVSTSWDQTVAVWEVETGELVMKFTFGTSKPQAVRFSPSGEYLAAAVQSAIRIWNVRTRELESVRLGHQLMATSMDYSPDGARIVSGGADRSIRTWHVEFREPVTLRGHDSFARSVALSPDDTLLASASRDGTVRLWDLRTRTELARLTGHANEVHGVVFTADGRRLVSVGADDTIRFWNAVTGRQLSCIEGHQGSWDFGGLAVSSSGEIASVGQGDQTVKLWDPETGELVELLSAPEAWLNCVAFSPDGDRLAAGGEQSALWVWDLGEGRVRQFNAEGMLTIKDVVFSPDGTLIAAADFGGISVLVWNADTGELVQDLKGLSSGVNSVAFSPDGRRLVSGDSRMIQLWDVETWAPALTLSGHKDFVKKIAFGSDGRWFVSASNDHTIKIWDTVPAEIRDRERREALALQEGVRPRVANLLRQGLTAEEVESVLRQDHSLEEGARRAALVVLSRSCEKDRARARARMAEIFRVTRVPEEARERVLELREVPAVISWALEGVNQHADRVARNEMRPMVDRLFSRWLLTESVVEQIRARLDLSEAQKDAAWGLALARGDEPRRLNSGAWRIAQDPNCTAEEYQRAALAAELVSIAHPRRWSYKNTLGVALYRVGDLERALAELGESDLMFVAARGHRNHEDLAFIAMAQHRLGRSQAAAGTLAELRNLVADGNVNDIEEARRFLAEAATVIEGE